MGIVYLFRANKHDLFKIGFTDGDPERRLGEVQTGCPYRLSIYAYIDLNGKIDAQVVERAIHRELARCRMSGEWFAISLERANEVIRCYGESPKAQEWGVKVCLRQSSEQIAIREEVTT